jgi:cytidylate kinase
LFRLRLEEQVRHLNCWRTPSSGNRCCDGCSMSLARLAPPEWQSSGELHLPDESRGDELRSCIGEAIKAVAAKGHVVIGAHGASFALATRGDLLRVFVTASAAARARRVARERGMEETEAERQVRAADITRADYLKRFYGVDDEVPTQYDLVVNTDVLSSGEAASIVAHAAG